jgi:uncharacterized membrane protein YkoI
MGVFPGISPKNLETGGVVMKKQLLAVVGAGMMVAGLAVAGTTHAGSANSGVREGTIRIERQTEADFASLAKITSDQAVQNALASVQGKVLKTELQNENGFLVYGVELVTPDKSLVDVKVDAGSGKVLTMDHDKADREGHEIHEHGGDRDYDE